MTKQPRGMKIKPVKAWAVFENGHICFVEGCDEYDSVGETYNMPLIYRRKKDAAKRGQDYRRVTISPSPKRGRK